MLQHRSTANSLTPSDPSDGMTQRKLSAKQPGKDPLSNSDGMEQDNDDDNNNDHYNMTWTDDYFERNSDEILVAFDFANTPTNAFSNNGEPWRSFLLIYIEATLYTLFFLHYYPTAGILFWISTAVFAAIFCYILKMGYQAATTFTSHHAALTMNGGFRYVEIINDTVADYTIPLILIQDIRIWPARYGKGRATLYFKKPVTFNAGPFRGVPLKEFLIQPLKDPNPVMFQQIVLYAKELLDNHLAKEKQKES